MSIEIRNLSKHFGAFQALREINLTLRGGELTALLGPSGSGKTTLLRILAGLDLPDIVSSTVDAFHAPPAAQVLFDGRDIVGSPVGRRGIGFVFQHYALFRHMTVFENIAFALRVLPRRARPARTDIDRRVRELLALIQLEGIQRRYPWQLSGGQRQRVALARTLAARPKILLLDEPFGALDARVRSDLRGWLRRLHDELHITSVLVTHDQEEALEVADRIVVINAGRIEQAGTPDEVFHQPATPFVMQFLGNVNLFHGRVEDGKTILGPSSEGGQSSPPSVPIFVRPHELSISRNRADASSLHATVTRVQSAGPYARVELRGEDGQPLQVELPHEQFAEIAIAVGEDVYVNPKKTRTFLNHGAGI